MKTIVQIGKMCFFSMILIVTACTLIKDDIQTNKHIQSVSKLANVTAQNFFDPNFILRANSHIKTRLSQRNDDELIDSLFNSLLALEISHPFADQLVSLIGYPIWSQAVVHPQVDSLYQTITVPFADVNDTLTRGMITSVLAYGEWHSYYVTRDTLYYLIDPSTVEDANVPGYLMSMIYYDGRIFVKADSILSNLYVDFKANSQFNNNQVIPRSCFIVETTLCYEITQNIENCYNFDTPETYCENSYHIYGCNFGEPTGGGGNGGADVGGSVGGNNGGGGGGSGSATDCGFTAINLPFLCPTSYNLHLYGIDFIRQYNELLPYLNPSQSNWLLEIGLNDPNGTTTLISGFNDFIANYTNLQWFNQELLGYYIEYLRNTQISHILSLTSLANLLSPYINGFTYTEETWIKTHPEALNYPNIENFLKDLNHLTFGGQDESLIDCLYNNIAVRDKIADILDANVTLDVCNPSNSTNSILKDAISASCQSDGNITLGEFWTNLSQTNDFLNFLIGHGLPIEHLNELGIDFSGCCTESDFETCFDESLP